MNLNSLFSPQSIALVGVSQNPDKIGHQIFQKLLSLKTTKVYPVNPKHKTILNHPCYPDIASLPQPIDQAIIAVPAPIVPLIVDQAVQAQVKNLVIVSSGFAETGSQGAQLETQIKTSLKNSSTSLLGPNCLGYANPSKKLDITFARTPPPSGNIALVSQSGAIGSYIFDWSKSENLGLSKFVSLGNRLDINENHCLEYLLKDKATKVIGLYLESFADGTKFLKIASQVTKQKPVIVLFGGQTQVGKQAAQSHTAALSPKAQVIRTALRQAGCLQAQTLEDFTDLLEVFSLEPKLTDNDIAILTNAGGPAILAADQIQTDQLHLTKLSDVLGDAVADTFKQALNNLTKIKSTDAFLIIISPQTNTELELTAKYIADKFKTIKKPVVVSLLGEASLDQAEAILKKHQIATIDSPKQAVKYLAQLYHYYHYINHRQTQYPARQSSSLKPVSAKKIQQIKTKLQPGPQTWQQIQTLTQPYNLPLAKTRIVTSANLKTTSQQLGLPLVLKSDSAEALHRTEKQGLYLNLNTPTAIAKAYQQLSRQFDTVLAQSQVKGDLELFIGFYRHQGFPPMITLGSGGIYTEIYQDVAHAFLPLNQKLILQLFKQTKIGQIIQGARGLPPLAIKPTINMILKLSQFVQDFPQIKSLDINPAIISKNDIQIVDIKLLIQPSAKTKPTV